jgi:hypothetical protein
MTCIYCFVSLVGGLVGWLIVVGLGLGSEGVGGWGWLTGGGWPTRPVWFGVVLLVGSEGRGGCFFKGGVV